MTGDPLKANFATVEEENSFRNFVWQSQGKDVANAFKLDKQNTTGNLNNRTVRKAYEEFGSLYQDYMGQIEEFKQKEEERPEGFTFDERRRENPLGTDIYGKNIYTDYNVNEVQPIDFKLGYLETSETARELTSRINVAIRQKIGFDGQPMENKMIYAESTGSEGMTEFFLGKGEVTIVNKYLDKKIVVDPSKLTKSTEETIRQFLNGYDTPMAEAWEGEKVFIEEQTNPLLEFNTYYKGNLITNLEDYEQVLFSDYKKVEVKIPVNKEIDKKRKNTEHKNNPTIVKAQETQPLFDYGNVEQINGDWYAYNTLQKKMLLITDVTVLNELNWSNSFKIMNKENEQHGAFDLFFGGNDNYIDAQVSMDNFFNLSEEDAAGLLNNRFQTLYGGLFEVEVTGLLEGGIGKVGTQYITVRETSTRDKKEVVIRIPGREIIGTINEKRNIARTELVKLYKFMRPTLLKLPHVKNGTDIAYDEYEEIIENIGLNDTEKKNIELEVESLDYENEFVNPEGQYHYHYTNARKILISNGVTPIDELFESHLKSYSLQYLTVEKEDIATQLKSKDFHNKIEDTERVYTVKNKILSKKEAVNKKISKFNIDLNAKYEQYVNHPDHKIVETFLKVYYGGGKYEYEKVDLTTKTIEGTIEGTRVAGGFGLYSGSEGYDFWKHEKDFSQDYSQEVSYYDEVEIELENGTKTMIPRGHYNEVVLAFQNLLQIEEDIKTFETETIAKLDELKSELGDVEGVLQVANLNYDDWEKTYTKLGYGFVDMYMNIVYGTHTLARNLMGTDASKEMTDLKFDWEDESNRIKNSFQKTWRQLDPTIETNLNPISAGFWSEANREWAWNGFVEQTPIIAAYMLPSWASYPVIFTSIYGDAQSQMEREYRETGKKRSFWEKGAIAFTYAASEVILGAMPYKYLMPVIFGGSKNGLSKLLWTKFVPKKWKLLNNSAVKNTIRSSSKYDGLVKKGLKTHLITQTPNLFVARYGEYYTEGWAQMIQNVVMGRPTMENVQEAQDLGYLIAGGMTDVSFAYGAVLNHYSDVNSFNDYNDYLSQKNDLLQRTNNLKLKIDLLKKQTQPLNKKQGEALLKAEKDINTNIDLMSDLDLEMENIIKNQEKKVLKIGNKYFGYFKQNFEDLQNIRLKAETVINNNSISEETKRIRLTKLKQEFDNLQAIRNTLKNEEVFGDHWRAFEMSQNKDDIKRREEIMGKVTTELIEAGNANPTDKQINEAAETEYYFQEINKDHNKNKRTKLARDFNNFQEVSDAIKAYDKLLNDGEISQNQYNKLVENAQNGTDLGATITLKSGDTFAYQIVRNAAKAGRTKTRVHEQGHQMIIEALGNNSATEALIAQQLLNFVQHKDNDLYVLLSARIEKNTDGSMKMNEVIPNFLELVAEGKIDFKSDKNMGFGSLIGNLFGFAVSDATKTKFSFDFEGEQDAVNFIIGLGKKLSDKSLTMKDRAQIKKRFISKDSLKKQTNKFKKQIQHSKDIAETNLNSYALDKDGKFNEELYKPNSPVIANELPGMIRAQINNYFNKRPALQVTEDGKQEMEADVMFRLYNVSKTGKSDVNGFDGRGDLYGYLNGRIKYRMLDHFKSPSSVVTNFSQKDLSELQEGLLEDVQPDVQPSVSKQKVRTLKDLSDLNLDNISEIQAYVQAEVDAMIEIDPDNLQEELDKLIRKEFRKLIIKDMGKISQKKGELIISDEYLMFFAEGYNDIVDALSVDVIKNNYNNLFEITEVSKEDIKKIDEETGKTTYYRKGIFNIKGNKAIFTKYFTQGGYTTLKDRQSALATLISEAVAKRAVDNYIPEKSNNENAIIDAKLRKISESLDRNKNEFKTFDNIQYSRQVEAKNFLNNLRKEIESEVSRKKRNGKPFHPDKGRAAEQAINNILQKYEDTMPGFVVVVKKATEKDNMADLSIGFKLDENSGLEEFQLVNIEIKLDAQKIKLTSKSVTEYDFINDEVFIKNDNFETINYTDAFGGSKKVFKQFYEKANELIQDINNGRFLDENGNVVKAKTTIPLMKTSNDFMPQIVYDRLKQGGYVKAIVETNVKKLNEDHVSEHHGKKKHPAAYIELIGNGLFSLGPDVFFNGKVPSLEMQVEGVFTVSKNSEQPSRAKATKGIKLRKKLYGLDMATARPRFVSRPIEGSVGFSSYSLADQQSMTDLSSMYTRKSVNISRSTKSNLTISEALLKARAIINYSKESRGMSAFDFDETLIIDGENFIEAKNPETGEIVKISSGRWPLDGPSYANLGYTFDFKDFVNVRGGVDGPLLTKFRNRIKKYGAENNYILTARPPESATAIHGWLKTKGINIPLKNITGLGNSTGEAKAMWIAGKYSEGYNDIYFVDDALPNVEAVADVINQLDIKGKSVQAKIQFSKDMSKEFNKIIQQVTGVPAVVKFSDVQAKLRGKGFKFNGIIPSSAQDFAGLLYNLIGKGKQGEKQFDFLKKALIDPFARGIDELNTIRQKAAEDYKNILKQLPEVKSDLNSLLKTFEDIDIPNSINDFTVDQAVRVYIWNKAGFEIPGLSIRDQRALSNFVKSQEDLVYFADVISKISKKQDGYAAPSEYWLTENIASDLMSDGAIGDVRAKFLANWIENKNEIFSKDNLNKLEAIYGAKYVEALKDVLYRMETGRQRPTGSNRLTNEFMNWTNGAIGSIMFFNIRSAVLQTISAVNYVNWSDNNPLLAAKAFANQPQYWKDFVMIFNSDFLKQRRAGNKRGINEQELSQAVTGKGAYEQAKAVVRFLLKQGFLPTQIADSFAISAGGASFYRNRVNTYIKKGLSKSEAETKAFLDFQETTEVSQQSGRPDLISQQQASPLGRLILAFGNYPMQAGRIIDKAARDLINGRGDTKTNISKIIYYGFVANVLFQSLQSALFAVIGDEEEDELDKKKTRILNGMVDTWFQTFGVLGKAISTVKNTIMEFNKQRAKDLDESFMTKSDHAYTLLQALSFSPPISSKLRKIYSSIQTERFNRQIMKERGLTLDNPVWSMFGNVIEGATNIPLGRISNKLLNLDNAMDAQHETWKRLALIMGWNTWDLGIQDPDLQALGEDIKERKKQEKEMEKERKKQQKLREKYPDLNDEQIEIKLKSKEIMDLRKHEQIDLLKILEVDEKEILKLKKEEQRSDKIAELYKDNEETIDKYLENSKNKSKEQIQKEVEEYKKSTRKKPKRFEGNTAREKALFKMKKADQINLLLELGYPNRDIKTLKYEKDRVAKIIELEKKSKNR